MLMRDWRMSHTRERSGNVSLLVVSLMILETPPCAINVVQYSVKGADDMAKTQQTHMKSEKG